MSYKPCIPPVFLVDAQAVMSKTVVKHSVGDTSRLVVLGSLLQLNAVMEGAKIQGAPEVSLLV